MDRIVIDCGVAIKWLIGGDYSDQARTILNRYRAETLTLLAPDFIRIEVANVLWNLQRLAGLTRETGQRAFDEFMRTEIVYTAAEELLTDAYTLALRYERSVYDSLYLALSIGEQCQLVTADERLYNAISKKIPNVVMLTNWS